MSFPPSAKIPLNFDVWIGSVDTDKGPEDAEIHY